ncbi:delta-aminolevulinic acid dehydratase [Gracilimonas sp.]|uniref:delta-aminolevulinic acid dehydratase n=1 Tax=Gracilimonas sp. TaxID=1974203 RepID=UPI0032ED361A
MDIKEPLRNLQEHLEHNEYRGYDPYDALKSPLFRLPIFKKSKLLRFGIQQLVKRFPFNIRPLLLISKGLNPVSLGLSIQAYAYLIISEPDKKDFYIEKIRSLEEELTHLIPEGYSGACWGYDFDWEARYAKIPAYQPTVVATGIIVNSLYSAWKITGRESLKRLVVSSADFVLKDLNRSYEDEKLCFSYSPFDNQKVFNASMKGVRILAQVYSLTESESAKMVARQAVEYVIQNQNQDGSWYYSQAKKGNWIDNYHTGYVLDCLNEYIELCKDQTFNENLLSGFEFYKHNFFSRNGKPSFYSDNIYPIDCTSASQSILTLLRFKEYDLAKKVANWTIENMQDESGYFYFRKFKWYTLKTSFMRWSNAWMFAALSNLLMYQETKIIKA